MPALSTRSLHQQLVAEAAAAHPYECCGLLIGRCGQVEEVRPCRNVHADPAMHFEIDPAALIAALKSARQGGPGVVGYYHSHPTGSAAPSDTDAACASGDGKVWAIVGGDRVGWWRDSADGFEEISPEAISG